MVTRAYLTKEFINSISPPEKGERWISDTVIKGFGLRIWRSGETISMAFAVRTSDYNGKLVRRTYNKWHDFREYCRPQFWEDFEELGYVKAQYPPFDITEHCSVARIWAEDQLAELKGAVSHIKQVQSRHRQLKRKYGSIVSQQSLDQVVEDVLCGKYPPCRYWHDSRLDSLRQSYVAYDQQANIGALTIQEISKGALIKKLRSNPPSRSHYRRFKSLIRIVLTCVSTIGGPVFYNSFREYEWPKFSELPQYDSYFSLLDETDFSKFLEFVRAYNCCWKIKIIIELSFIFRAPITKITSAKWSDIRYDCWVPNLSERDQNNWRGIYRIDEEVYRLLVEVQKNTPTNSDFWFPGSSAPMQSIQNFDRQWKKVVHSFGWPEVTLSRLRKQYWEAKTIIIDLREVDRDEMAKRLEAILSKKKAFLTKTGK